MLKALALVIIILIAIFVFFRNLARKASNAGTISQLRSGRMDKARLMDELILRYGIKNFEGRQFNTEELENTLKPGEGKFLSKDKYRLEYVGKMDEDNLVLRIKTIYKDSTPAGVYPLEMNYKNVDFHTFRLNIDNNTKQMAVYSDVYADLRSKLDKEDIARSMLNGIIN